MSLGILFLDGCKKSVNSIDNTNNDISIDKNYLKALGGDPRGSYTPNSPFVSIFNPQDSLVLNSGNGILQILGSNPDSGSYFLQLTAQVRTKFMSNLYTYVTVSDTANGVWKVNGTNIAFTDNGFTRTVSFSADSKGFYLIYPHLSSFPPMTSLMLGLLDAASADSTVWVFKKN